MWERKQKQAGGPEDPWRSARWSPRSSSLKTEPDWTCPGSCVLATVAATQIADWFPVRPVFAHKSPGVRGLQKWDRANLAYVGLDTHKEQHSAVMLDYFGDRLGSLDVQNRPVAFPAFLKAVQALAPGKHLLFGLENTTTWGRGLAGYLPEHGQ